MYFRLPCEDWALFQPIQGYKRSDIWWANVAPARIGRLLQELSGQAACTDSRISRTRPKKGQQKCVLYRISAMTEIAKETKNSRAIGED